MQRDEIESRIRQIISSVTGTPADRIDDSASFRKELNVDSLSLIEIAVDIDHAFRLGLPEDGLYELDTVAATADVVERELAARQASRSPV